LAKVYDDRFLTGYASSFHEWHYAFCPVVIEEHDYRFIERLQMKQRLPFSEDSQVIGEGGFG
jgi:hypothetical protein